jgi:TetR/AcrR family transcriptional regulator, tetracycline repressor protein
MAEARAQLSRELITSTAVELVEREGLDALSMRRLAQELDVWPMSVYRHFRDKDDLLDAVAAAGADEVDMPRARGNWRQQLPALAEEARVILARQPPDLRRRTIMSGGVLQLTDAALKTLRAAGLPSADAATAWAAVLAYVLGSIELAAAAGTERRARAALLASADDDHPDVEDAAPELARSLTGGETAFREGLERLLDGISAMAP